MNSSEFDEQFNRLTDHFHLPGDSSRDTIAVDWFRAVQHYHVDALDRGVTELIRHAKDRFWPALGKLTDAIKSRMAGVDRTRGQCLTCHGTTWIEAQPWKSNGRIYTGFQRCPDCGVPAPEYRGVGQRDELTVTECQQWRDGTFQAPAMHLAAANSLAADALRFIDPHRGRMKRAISGVPRTQDGAA